MRLKNYTLRTKLLCLACIFGVASLFVILFTNSSLNKLNKISETTRETSKIKELTLKMRKNEKDFLIIETKDLNFYKTGTSYYKHKLDSNHNELSATLRKLNNNKFISQANLDSVLYETKTLSNSYYYQFQKIYNLTLEKGFKDYGKIGIMRDRIHKIEYILNENSYSPHLINSMLMMRRHEKD